TPFKGKRVRRPVTVAGTWDVTVAIGDREMSRVLTLQRQGEQLTGEYRGDGFSNAKLGPIALDDDRLEFPVEIAMEGRQPIDVQYELVVQGDRMSGTASINNGQWSAPIRAKRRRDWGDPIRLIDEAGLGNWEFQRVGRENHWSNVDGTLVNEAAGWNIYTKEKFQNYKLQLEVKVPPRGNSGIYLNGRYEVQVADGYGKKLSEGGIGAIYGRAVPTANPSKPADEWQKFEIRFVDYWVSVTLNGTNIVDNVLIEGITGGALDSDEASPGPLMLQGDHGPIEYRDIVLTPLRR
ncbi:MAG: DUF1080 domain-containing protein, partial [Planctomycetota bacterium]